MNIPIGFCSFEGDDECSLITWDCLGEDEKETESSRIDPALKGQDVLHPTVVE